MSNTITNLMPTIYAAKDIVLRELTGFIAAVTRDASGETAAKDQTVRYPVVPALSASAITPAATGPDPSATTQGSETMTIDKVYSATFFWEAEEQKGLGGMYEVPHGLICALLLRPVLRFNASAIREDCGRLLRCTEELDGPVAGSAADPVEWLQAEIDGLFRLYGLPENLKGFGIREADIPEIARRSSGSSMSGNPVEVPQSERERMLERLL